MGARISAFGWAMQKDDVAGGAALQSQQQRSSTLSRKRDGLVKLF